MKNKPLVTVVTITYNLKKAGREKHFKQCLESVHKQTYKNIEHLIIDGASTDGTVDLLKEYVKKGWIRYISEPDKGIYDAMSKGIVNAKGKYIAFLNSDDFYHNKEGIALSVAALELSGADFSYAPVRMVNEDDTPINFFHPHTDPKISHTFFTMPFCHQTMVAKTKVLLKEKFNSEYRSAGDYELVLRMAINRYKPILVKDKFVTFRLGGVSDKNQKQSQAEVAKAYFENYSKFSNITEKECSKIYCKNFDNIPFSLVNKLKEFPPYFSEEEYIETLVGGMKKELVATKKALKKARSEIKSIYNSKGWKIILKVRWLAAKMRRNEL